MGRKGNLCQEALMNEGHEPQQQNYFPFLFLALTLHWKGISKNFLKRGREQRIKTHEERRLNLVEPPICGAHLDRERSLRHDSSDYV